MSILQTMEKRAKLRAQCRAVADDLLQIILERIDKLPEDLQLPTISMLQNELNVATKETKGVKP